MPGRAAFIVALLLLCPGSGEEVSVSSRKYDYSTDTCIKTKAEAEGCASACSLSSELNIQTFSNSEQSINRYAFKLR